MRIISFILTKEKLSFDRKLVVQISQSASHGIYLLIFSVSIFVIYGITINFVFELKFISYIISSRGFNPILIFANNSKLPILFDDLANIINKSVKRIYLLSHETIFREVAIYYLPGMTLVYSLAVFTHILKIYIYKLAFKLKLPIFKYPRIFSKLINYHTFYFFHFIL